MDANTQAAAAEKTAFELPAGLTPQDVDVSRQQLFQGATMPLFFETMAARGYSPSNESEAQSLLKLAMTLVEKGWQSPGAQSTGQDKYASVLASLESPQLSPLAQTIKQAAYQLACNPELYEATAVYAAVEAAATAGAQ